MTAAAAVGTVSLRPSTAEDRAFQLRVYAATRAEELAQVPWPEEAKRAFVADQFARQDDAYRGAYPDGRFLIVEEQGVPIGRLYLGELPGELRVIDIALLPDTRGRGIGSALMADIMVEATDRGLPVTLHVERWNPAFQWYQRLGFVEVADRGVYVLLRREAPAA